MHNPVKSVILQIITDKGDLPMSDHEILTMKEAIGYLKISERTLLKLIKEGKIRNLRVGNRYRFIKSELEEDLRGANKN